jgi:hypothetical protein
MDIVVYTACFGNTDPLHEPQVVGGARFVCFTDQDVASTRWEIRRLPPVQAPTRESRIHKLASHLLFPEADVTIWMDCCFELLTPPEDIVAAYPGEITVFRHRDRTRIQDEAAEIIRLHKALPEATRAQLAAYQSEGFDTDAAPMSELSCNGVVMRRNTPAVAALNELWLQQIRQHTLRDQMSLDYCLWKLGMKPGRWPGPHDACPHFRHQHYKRPVNDY